MCEGLLTQEECKQAIFAMQKNKAPGSDGISVEFYQVFWPRIKDFFVEALNENYSSGLMSNTQRKGLITLLFKKGDSQELKNWRPITLLNCDYKIIAAVLAARVQKVIGAIVNGNQTASYAKGRLAACNVRLTKDVIEYLMKSDKTGGVWKTKTEDRRPKTGERDRGSSLSLSLLVHVYDFPLIVPRANTCTREIRGGERGREKTSDPPSSVFVFQNILGCFG